jgi:hypothetical protein
VSPHLSYDRPRYVRLPPVIDDLAYGEEVIAYTQQRLTLWLLLPGVAVVVATVILLIAVFPGTVWHFIYRLVIRLPNAKAVRKGSGVRSGHLSLPGLRAVLALVAAVGWLGAVAFFCIQLAEWRYSVYVLTNVRLVRRFVNFDWHNRGGIVSLRFQVIRKVVLLREVGSVTKGVLNGIRINNWDGSLIMSISHIPRATRFLAFIEEARSTQFHST